MFEPVDPIEPNPERAAATRGALIAHAATHGRRRRRWPLIVIPVLAGAAVLGGGALSIFWPTTNEVEVHCFARPDVLPGGGYPSAQLGIGRPDGKAEVIEDAVAACTDLWEAGFLDPDAPDGLSRNDDGVPTADPANTDVPDKLTVCVMPGGAPAVVPGGRAVCSAVGLPRELDL